MLIIISYSQITKSIYNALKYPLKKIKVQERFIQELVKPFKIMFVIFRERNSEILYKISGSQLSNIVLKNIKRYKNKFFKRCVGWIGQL